MKKQTCRLLSAVLSATTVMSMLTSVATVATDGNGINDVIAKADNQSQLSGNQQTNTAVAVDDNVNPDFYGPTGDRTLENKIIDDSTIINSDSEYYKLTGKKYKVPSGDSLTTELPKAVDNSLSDYFPEICNQGKSNSCTAWAQVYYQFTYEMNKSRGVTTTPENTFSPKFIYNLSNGGLDSGSTSYEVYNNMKK
ncbi:MAG: hypothetical protein UE295_11780 [Acutalibacteraceae bacterium]|nr:hypothetical protein [Acutalibacteraceae bacterium]